MYQWAQVVDRLRVVRGAQEDFTVRFVVDYYIIGPMLLDRLAVDLDKNHESASAKLQGRGRPVDES